MSKTIIFTDGSSRGNPGPGGWGAIIQYDEMRESRVRELGGRNTKTTNNRMELTAVIEALDFVLSKKLSEGVVLYTDSEYVKKGATEWMYGWYKNNWKTSTKSDVLNKDLWQKMVDLVPNIKLEIKVIPGHFGIAGNERCDVIATGFADNDAPRLFNGMSDEYKINLDVTKQIFNSSVVSKEKTSNKKAYSYVSSIQGVVKVHKSWAECEERVRGKSNARYKKVFSKEEENELVRSFTHR